jgi:lysyl-tRNA synthetase class 2
VSPFHHPEFTLLEWYREGADYNAIMRDTQNLFAALIEKIQPRTKGFFGDFQTQKVAWDKLTICDAFTQYAKMDILSTFAEDGTLYEEKLRREATKSGVYCSKNDHWDDIFYRVLLEKVEPQLSGKPPTFLVDYPLPVGALAKRSGSDRKVCERAELYVCGLEVGNGFSELCDPKEQLERFENDYEYISKVYGKAPPIDYELIEALNSIQSAAGMALGIDRLLMLFTGATDIKEVLWLPMTLGSDQKH